MNMTTHLLVAAVALTLSQQLLGAPPTFPSEADKADRIKAFLAKYTPKLQRGSGEGDHSAAFCNAFYSAMKRADKTIAYVEPVVKTDDPNHPGLAHYRACADYLGPRFETIYAGDISSIGDRAYRLYRLETTSRGKKAADEIIYGEQIIPGVPGVDSVARFSGYQQVDFKKCEHYKELGVTPEGVTENGAKESLNAMIRYQGRYYVLKVDRSSSRNSAYVPIDLHAYQRHDKKNRQTFPLACSWTYLSDTRSGE